MTDEKDIISDLILLDFYQSELFQNLEHFRIENKNKDYYKYIDDKRVFKLKKNIQDYYL